MTAVLTLWGMASIPIVFFYFLHTNTLQDDLDRCQGRLSTTDYFDRRRY